MKIWIITKYASSYETGFESRIFALARRFVKYGNDVVVITSDSNHFGIYPRYNKTYNFENIDGIDVTRIRTVKYNKTVSINRILSWFDFELKLFFLPINKIKKPDVIIVSSLSLLSVLNGVKFKNFFNAKLIFEIRDIWPLSATELGISKKNIFIYLLSKIEKFGYKNSDLVVGTMPNLIEHINQILGFNRIKCICIPFGFDLKFYNNLIIDSDSFRKKYNLPEHNFIIGYAGSIGHSNGLHSLIECAKHFSNDSRFIFFILGDGDLKQYFIEETNGYKNIIFLNKVNKDEVGSFLNLCDVLYFSSSNSEIWKYGWSPNKIIDYMMSGKPVLASYSGFQSMINEAKSGFFTPSEDVTSLVQKIEYIYSLSKSDLNDIGLRGKEWLLKNRNWDVITSDYLEHISKLVNIEK
jgi:glycosyltransferase involved in cell wall biosynthesis